MPIMARKFFHNPLISLKSRPNRDKDRNRDKKRCAGPSILVLLFSPICPSLLTDKINLSLVFVYKSNAKGHFLPD